MSYSFGSSIDPFAIFPSCTLESESTGTSKLSSGIMRHALVTSLSLFASWSIHTTRGFQIASTTNINTIGSLGHRAHRRHHYAPSPRRPASPPSFELASSPDDGDDGDGDGTTTSIDPTTKAEIRKIANHLAGQTLETVLDPSDAKAIFDELLFDNDSRSAIFNDDSYEQYVKLWKKAERRLRDEGERTPAEVLGKELTDRILSSVRGDKSGGGGSSYDAKTVLAFLESDAVNSLFARLLYDAIFEFTTKFDVLGNAISKLPLLGPVRNQVLKESKRNMDRTLGPLLQRFLSGYTRVAVRQAADFVVSGENASAFGKANAKLAGYLLRERTVAEWIPEIGRAHV